MSQIDASTPSGLFVSVPYGWYLCPQCEIAFSTLEEIQEHHKTHEEPRYEPTNK